MSDKLKLAACALLPFILFCTRAAAGQAFEDGRRAYDLGEYAAAKTIWVALAQAGDSRSAASLGYLFRDGKGVARNANAAAHWYYQAAMRGDATAQSALCAMHLTGEGIRRDVQAALLWCELSIEGGDTGGIALRERALRQITTEQRDEVWSMIARWHAGEHDGLCRAAAVEAQAQYADVPAAEKK